MTDPTRYAIRIIASATTESSSSSTMRLTPLMWSQWEIAKTFIVEPITRSMIFTPQRIRPRPGRRSGTPVPDNSCLVPRTLRDGGGRCCKIGGR